MFQAKTRLTKFTGRRVIPAVATLVMLSFALMAGLLIKIAERQDRHAAEEAGDFARAAIQRRREAGAREIKDYSNWGEAYQHLHVTTDIDWAFTQQNVGTTLFTDLGYDDVLVVGPNRTVTYAVIDGQLASHLPPGLDGPGLQALVDDARAAAMGDGKPVVGFLATEGAPLLVSAAAITTAGLPNIVPVPGPPSIMVFADALTPDRLNEIGVKAFVQGLRVSRHAADGADGSSLIETSADKASSIVLRWDPEQPGRALLVLILPWLAVAGVAFATLVVLILRRTLLTTQLIEENAHALTDAHRKAEHSALHDGVTELPNRLMLHRYLKDALGDFVRSRSVAVIFVDLDRFKPINDALGHRAGDRVLRETADRLQSVAQECDIVARVGGDEFVLAFKGLLSDADAERICERLLDTVRRPITIEGSAIQVGLSIGVAFAQAETDDAETILRHADIAMYQAKVEGGNGYRFFSTEMNDRILASVSLEQDIQRAIEAGEFVLHYQPRYHTASLRLMGVEALIRWNHPERGLLGPAEFIAVAEKTGSIVALGHWALRRACRTIAAYPDIAVSVNLSSAQFRGADVVEQVAMALRESGLPAARLELELTESVLLEDVEQAQEVMSRLKALGLRLAMDDFGTGYSSLGYLQRFPFDRLKIDQKFIADLRPTGDARAIVQAIIGLSRALRMDVTAEGVETAEQLLILRADQCDEVQGYHLSRPLCELQLAELLASPSVAAPIGAKRLGMANG